MQGWGLLALQNQAFDGLFFILLLHAKMTTRKTTTGYKVTIDFDQWQEKFDFYEDVKVCFKNVSRDYALDRVTEDFRLADWEIDYLLGNVTKKEVLENETYTSGEDFKVLDGYKKDFEVVWLSFGEHSNVYIWFGDDGVMLVEKDASQELIKELVDELDSWMNWRIYRVDIYEPEKYTSDENGRKLICWNYVDCQGGYFKPEDALDSLPDYAGEIIKESETERFEEFERC